MVKKSRLDPDKRYIGFICAAEPHDAFQRAVARLQTDEPVSDTVHIRLVRGEVAAVPRDLEFQINKHKGMKASFLATASDVQIDHRLLLVAHDIQILNI